MERDAVGFGRQWAIQRPARIEHPDSFDRFHVRRHPVSRDQRFGGDVVPPPADRRGALRQLGGERRRRRNARWCRRGRIPATGRFALPRRVCDQLHCRRRHRDVRSGAARTPRASGASRAGAGHRLDFGNRQRVRTADGRRRRLRARAILRCLHRPRWVVSPRQPARGNLRRPDRDVGYLQLEVVERSRRRERPDDRCWYDERSRRGERPQQLWRLRGRLLSESCEPRVRFRLLLGWNVPSGIRQL